MNKFLTMGFVSGVISASGQSNLPPFRTPGGTVVSNAECVRVEHSKLIYRMPGGGGVIKLKDLPEELRSKLGFDEQQAARDEALENEQLAKRRAADREAVAGAAAREAIRRRHAEVLNTATIVWGRVVQRLDEGLLVNADSQINGPRDEDITMEEKSLGRKAPLAKGFVLLTDYPNKYSVVDGDVIWVVGYPVGDYSYTAVSGGKKTVRRYTADIDNVVPASEAKAILRRLTSAP